MPDAMLGTTAPKILCQVKWKSRNESLKLQLLETSMVLMCYAESIRCRAVTFVTCHGQFVLDTNFSAVLFIMFTICMHLLFVSSYVAADDVLLFSRR
jgi:hypothetical protein